MNLFKKFLFAFIILFGIFFVVLLYLDRPTTPMDSTLAPAYQLLGRTTKSFNRAMTKIIPVNDMDEKKYGEAIEMRYASYSDKSCKEYKYCNDLMKGISKFRKKPFEYRVYILKQDSPNAFAMPGGIIFVTQGLLEILRNESELVSVLAHEMGHIERSHCFDAVRFEVLSKKLGKSKLGRIADISFNLMLRHSFSKTQENEADNYAFQVIKNTDYNPHGVGDAFRSLLNFLGKNNNKSKKANLFKDYFMSHPHLEHRCEKYTEEAERWWKKNRDKKKYAGEKNLRNRISYDNKKYESEWKEIF